MSIILHKEWLVNGVRTDVTTFAVVVTRTDTNAEVYNGNLTRASEGVYTYVFEQPAINLTYSLVYTVTDTDDQVYVLPTETLADTQTEYSPELTCSYTSLVNDLGFSLFGLRPTFSNVITDGVTTANQTADILRCIAKGLQFVYGAYRWSFLRPMLSITTYPVYSTGTIAIDASGNVTLDASVEPSDGGFPTYAVTGGGMLLTSSGSWKVSTRTSSTALVLEDYAASGGQVVSTPITYRLVFNRYPVTSGYDSFDGEITFAPAWGQSRTPIRRVDPVEIRRRLQENEMPRRPEVYALFTETFDPTVGSTRYFSFWPIPDQQYQLEVTGTWMPSMIDATNKYPLGGTVLSEAITEACLAVSERDIKGIDAGHPDAVHARALIPALQAAISRDREYSAPDTLGVDYGPGVVDIGRSRRREAGSVQWLGGGYVGFIP